MPDTVLGTGIQKWKRCSPRPLAEGARDKNANTPSEWGYNRVGKYSGVAERRESIWQSQGKIHSRGDIRSRIWRRNGGLSTKDVGRWREVGAEGAAHPQKGKYVKQAKGQGILNWAGRVERTGRYPFVQGEKAGVRSGESTSGLDTMLSVTGSLQ